MRKIFSLLFAITLFGIFTACSKSEEDDVETTFTLCDKTEYRKLYGSMYSYFCTATIKEYDANGKMVRKDELDLESKPKTIIAHKDAVKLTIRIYSKVTLGSSYAELTNHWMYEPYDLKLGENLDIVYDDNTVFSSKEPK